MNIKNKQEKAENLKKRFDILFETKKKNYRENHQTSGRNVLIQGMLASETFKFFSDIASGFFVGFAIYKLFFDKNNIAFALLSICGSCVGLYASLKDRYYKIKNKR